MSDIMEKVMHSRMMEELKALPSEVMEELKNLPGGQFTREASADDDGGT